MELGAYQSMPQATLGRAYLALGHICRKSSSDGYRLSPEDTAGMGLLVVTDPDKKGRLGQVSAREVAD
jgi:hypothetical protein